METGGNITEHLTPATYKASPIPADDLKVHLLLTFSVKIEGIFKLINDLFDYEYTGQEAENNKEQSGDDKEINIKLTGEENAKNKNNENVIDID